MKVIGKSQDVKSALPRVKTIIDSLADETVEIDKEGKFIRKL